MKSGKVWGETLEIVTTPFCSLHRAKIKAGYACSMHYHAGRANLFFVESGQVLVRVLQPNGLEDETVLNPGESAAVAQGLKHRFECLEDAVVFELYYPPSMALADIVRDDTGGKLLLASQ
jgi:mannose-6-phosphate isomerase-like protein (cupin superfamily)